MPAIGNGHPVISLIQKKTKIKRCDIIAVLKCLPEVVPEAFLEANLPMNKPMDFGAFSMRWSIHRMYGAHLKIRLVKSAAKKYVDLKFEGKTPLAKHLFELMGEKQRQMAVTAKHKRQ